MGTSNIFRRDRRFVMKALSSLLLVLIILVIPLIPTDALSIPCCIFTIDDFTQGAMNPTNGPFEDTHTLLPAESCFGGSRHIIINDMATISAGMVPYGGSNFAFWIQTEEHGPPGDVTEGADVVLEYEMAAPTDLTAGGVNDRLILDVISVSDMSVFIKFYYPGHAVAINLQMSPGPNVLLFSTIAIGDLTQITRVEFYFNEQSPSGASEALISRIRVTGDIERYAFMDLPTLIETGPPYPLPGPLMEFSYFDDGGGVEAASNLALTLVNAYQLPVGPSQIPFPVNLNSSDSGEGRDPGLSAGFQGYEGAPVGLGKSSHSEGAFEFTVALQSRGDHFPYEILLPVDAVSVYDDVFYIPFEVEVRGAAGGPLGTLSQRIRVQVPDTLAYDFADIMIHPPVPESPLDFSFEFSLRDDAGGAVPVKAEGQSLFDIQIEGDWFEYSDPSASPPLRLNNDLVLSARPSVMSDRTQLRLNRSLERMALIHIYDLAGRALRTLELPAGQIAMTWDARDDTGRLLPTGVYLARVIDGQRSAVRRLVVVR